MECEYLTVEHFYKYIYANQLALSKGLNLGTLQHFCKSKTEKGTYSHRIKGRISVGSFAIFTMSQTRIYMGQTISVDGVLAPPPS